MASQGRAVICARCGRANTPINRYCATCGEPIDPRLIADLQRDYTVLTALDAQIAQGLGSATVESLRDTIRERYLAQRRPLGQPAPAATAAAATAAAAHTLPEATPAEQPQPWPTPPVAPVAPVAPAQPHGPVFSWRAFIAEQAIAVMAYLGGFLLLIATLTFEVGGWQALPDIAKLGGVLVVYVVFGLLGVSLRRVTSLRTVSRVYLGVFALMTPLAALAVYRFELQARGFSVAGMVCLAAAYAAVVYLALAARTRFITYAYLGWMALLVAALAIPSWALLSREWVFPIIAVMALLLLTPRALRQRGGAHAADWLATLELPATQISAAAAMLAAVATIVMGMQATSSTGAMTPMYPQQRAAFAAAACALVPLSAAWSWAARTFTRRVAGDLLQALDWTVAATVALAASAVAVWLHAHSAGFAYTLTAVALLEGLAAEGVRWRAPARTGLRIGVQILGAVLVGGAALSAASIPPPNTPLLVACVAGVTLGLLAALRGSLAGVIPWGLMAGIFTLIGAQTAFSASVPADTLYARADRLPDALAQLPTLYGLLALALVGVGLGLRAAPLGSRLRRLRVAVQISALVAAGIASIALTGHTREYAALHLGVFALVALVVARVERRPVAAGVFVGIFGAAGALSFILANANVAALVALPVALAIATLALRRWLGRAYSLPIYSVTLLATMVAFAQIKIGTPDAEAFAALGWAGWMALAVAFLLTIDALISQAPLWMIAPALVALMSALDARNLWPAVTLALALAAAGALLRRTRGAGWEAAWHGAAVVASALALTLAQQGDQASPTRTLGLALLFAVVAYLVAWQERLPWLTATLAPYALVALWQAGALPISADGRLATTLGVAVLFTIAGMLARWRLGRAWALALYAIATIGIVFTALRVTPYPQRAGLLEAILLGFAALAYLAALLEETPWAALAPAILAAAAAFAQPDGRALLPLALALAAAAFAVSRTRGAAWALPLYTATIVAAVAAAWQGRAQAPGFEVAALVTLALAAWLLAALESRGDALLVAFVFATLAVSAAARAFAWDAWLATLAYAALAWAFELSGAGWARIPWLQERSGVWIAPLGRTAESRAAWRNPRRAGQRISRGAAALVAVGVVIGGLFAPHAFTTYGAQTQALAVALLSLAALLTRIGWGAGWRPALYLAGEALALCVSWELRWLGAHNIQAWILAPGSAQLIIGALLPADRRLRPPAWVAQTFSVVGAMTLLLPTLGQSMTEAPDWQWRYALLLAVEALALTLLAVGLRNRILALTGSAFVGVAAIRGAIIAVQQNLPAPLVIGVVALALMGLATWLSLRARHMQQHSPTTPATPGGQPGPHDPGASAV
ncbi:MAG TPA: zinc ribbon domain-containing protein [Ktedonobacterales bacterium]